MNTRILIAGGVVAGLMNPIAAVISASEHQKDAAPVLLALFAIPWLVGAYLLHRGQRTAGAIVLGVLALLTLVQAPSWKRGSTADWTAQLVAVAACAAVLVGAVAVLVRRYRSPRLSGAVR